MINEKFNCTNLLIFNAFKHLKFKIEKLGIFKLTHLPKICLQTANGDFDFLNDKNMCSACWRCSVLTMEGGALRVKHTQSTLV